MAPVSHLIDWLINLPQGHVMDCVLAYGATDGKVVPYIIKKQHNCKWIQLVLEEPGRNITNLSESEKWQQAEVVLPIIWDVPQVDVVEVKESTFLLVLLFDLSGKFEMEGWEIEIEAISALDDETYTQVCFFPRGKY